jgi:branched-chain amino acid transport system permease protein
VSSPRRWPTAASVQQRAPWSLAVAVVGLALVYYLPYVVPSFQLILLTSAAAAAIAIMGLNLLFGYTGQISVGHAAFLGLGAYGTGVLVSKYHWSYVPAMAVSVLLAFVVGLLISAPALRLRGLYLALVTLAVGVSFPGLLLRFANLTNGDLGIFNVQWQAPSFTGLYGLDGQEIWGFWLSGGCLVLAGLLVHNLLSSRVGRSLIAVRDHEVAAAAAGIRVTTVKALTFAVAGSLGALGGALTVASIGVISPSQFGLEQSIELLVAMVVGGAATLRGSIIGGAVYVYLPYYTSQLVSGPVAGVVFGAAIIVAVFVAPDGLDGLLVRLVRLSRRSASPLRRKSNSGTLPEEEDAESVDRKKARSADAQTAPAHR